MKWPSRTVAAACIVVGMASSSFAGQVKLEIRDGLVTLDAKDATLREIFAEWARVGSTRVVNVERVAGGLITVQLTRVPEHQALETLLRSAAGFLAVPRAVPQASASMYDRILVMPGTRPTTVPTSAGPAPSGQPQSPWARDRIVQQPSVVVDDEDEAVPNPQVSVPGAVAGMPQQGVPTAPVPYSGAGMASPNGSPFTPNPSAQPPATPPRPGPPMPQSASRPGVTTAPVPPIKGPGGH
jgi:hypothetical protein